MSKLRLFVIFFTIVLIVTALEGCGKGGGGTTSAGPAGASAQTKTVSCTSTPKIDVHNLIAGGGDYYGTPHPGKPSLAGSGGTVCGDVKVWNDKTNLHVLYETTGGWYMTGTHLYVGLIMLPNNHPGQFPFKHEGLANVTTDEYILPLHGYYPKVGDGCKHSSCLFWPPHGYCPKPDNNTGVRYDWPVGWTLSIAAQADVATPTTTTKTETQFVQGWFGKYGLWGNTEGADKTDVLVGYVDFSISGTNLVCDITTLPTADYPDGAPFMTSTHYYVGVDVPSFAPGQQPWKHDGLAGVASDEFSIPLSGSYPDGTAYEFTPGESLYFDVEVNGDIHKYFVSSDWATAWGLQPPEGNGYDPRFIFQDNNPNGWRSYSQLSLPSVVVTVTVPGDPRSDTAWGLGTWGTWFRNWSWYFRDDDWGWWFFYRVT